MRSRRIRPSSTPISASRIKEHCVIALGQFLEVLIGGLMSGVLYSLVALGFVLIFKASGVFNFAQGAMVLLAGLALVRSLDLLVANGFPLWAAIIFGIGFAVVIMAITAWLIERFVIGPLVNQDGLTLFMSTIGVTFILEGAAQMIFGSDAYPLRLFPTDAWFLFENLFPGGILVNKLDVWGGFIAGILVAGLAIFFSVPRPVAHSGRLPTTTWPRSRSGFQLAGSGSWFGLLPVSLRWLQRPCGVPSWAYSSPSLFSR